MTHNTDVYDIEKACGTTGGNKKLAQDLVSMLIQQLPLQNDDITKSYNNNDITNLKQHVHKLHGSSQCCGTIALTTAVSEYEVAIEENANNRFAACHSQLLNEIDRVLKLDITKIYSDTI